MELDFLLALTLDESAKNLKTPLCVIPAEAGI
jgi:hypothetical protein